MRERELQQYLYNNPEVLFPGRRIGRVQKEYAIAGRRADLVIEVDEATYIVELKAVPIQREHVGQLAEYYGLMRQSGNHGDLRMMLVAPSIPPFRAEFLEGLGIDCVEVPSIPVDSSGRTALVTTSKKALKRSETRAALASEITAGDSFRPEDVNADLTARKVALAHRLMGDTLVSVQQDFVEYDVMPRSITRKHSNDISLEFEPDRGHGEERFVRGGVWFAFRFGQGKSGPLNDVPNVSIIFFEHGLDLVINCEVAASQMRFLKRITTAPARFDELIGANSGLFLKAYLKFEQQPIGYHWILTEYLTGDSISANRVEAIHSGYEHKYEEYRTKWLDYIELHSDELSDDQRVHMRKMNRRLNLAWRLGRNVAKDDPMWLEPHEEQVRFFRREIAKMKPLVEFFVPKA